MHDHCKPNTTRCIAGGGAVKKEEVTAKIKAATGKKRFAFSTDKDAKPSK